VSHPRSGHQPASTATIPTQSPYPYGSGAAEDAYGYRSPFAPTPRRRPVWAYVVTGAMLLGAAVLIVSRVSLFDPGHPIGSASDGPKTLAPQKDGAKQHKPDDGSSPANTRRASGPRWSMQIPRAWTSFNVPRLSEEAAWRTPGGVAGYGDLVTIMHERPASSVDLLNYVYGASTQLQAGVGSGAIHVSRTHAYTAHGEIEYRTNLDGRLVRSLVYIAPTSTGYVSATFEAPAATYKHDLKRVEKYLKTLAGR
jgi:hypothetical protein